MSKHADITDHHQCRQDRQRLAGRRVGPRRWSTAGNGAALSMATAADGTISFAVDGNAVTLGSGALAGKGQALTALASTRTQLDTIAGNLASTVNTRAGKRRRPGGQCRPAAFLRHHRRRHHHGCQWRRRAGDRACRCGANSRNPGNLNALRSALDTSAPASAMDSVLFGISSAVAGRTVTRDALQSIVVQQPAIALQAQAGVDLDQEAVEPHSFPAGLPGLRPGHAGRHRHLRHHSGDQVNAMTIISTSTSAFFDRARSDMKSLRIAGRNAAIADFSAAAGLSRSSDDPVAASRMRALSRLDALSQDRHRQRQPRHRRPDRWPIRPCRKCRHRSPAIRNWPPRPPTAPCRDAQRAAIGAETDAASTMTW